jgi:hypothetical protein
MVMAGIKCQSNQSYPYIVARRQGGHSRAAPIPWTVGLGERAIWRLTLSGFAFRLSNAHCDPEAALARKDVVGLGLL